MNTQSTTKTQIAITRGVVVRFAQIVVMMLVQAAVLFLSAGSLAYVEGWAYMGMYVGIILLNALLMLPGGTELIEERGRIAKNTRGWDRVLMIIYTLAGFGILLVAGLDWRNGWTPSLGFVLQATGWAVMTGGYLLFSWAMVSNKFFSAMVRIQEERGHAVASAGPYRFVRHPGYLGIIIFALATPVMFSSWWVVLPAALIIITIVIRTLLEDQTLMRELPGYAEFAGRVRYRIVPGVW